MTKSILIGMLLAILGWLPLNPTDDDLLFNCHLHGNKICGSGVPSHGFVNL